MWDDTRSRAEKTCAQSAEPKQAINDGGCCADAAEVVRPLRNFRLKHGSPPLSRSRQPSDEFFPVARQAYSGLSKDSREDRERENLPRRRSNPGNVLRTIAVLGKRRS